MADFVIIGGGVYGCATAWELASKGAEVCLLEAKTIASGASGGLGSRGVRASGRDVRELPLMEEAYDIWPTLHEQLDGPTHYKRLGQLLLIEEELDLVRLEPQMWLQNQNGIESHLLSSEELREYEPYLSENIRAAIFTPNDGIADHTLTTQSYANAARKLGADIREGTAAHRLELNGNKVMAVITAEGEQIPVGKAVLLASNTHSRPFLQAELDITLPVWKMQPQVMHTEPVDPQPVRHLIGHASRTLAMKPSPGNRVMISGGWHGVLNPKTGQVEPAQDQVDGNLAQAVATYPCLSGAKVEEVSVERPELISQDGVPIIDTFAGAENMVVATGWCGHGWAIAPSTARHIANWLYTGNRPERLDAFRYSRFFSK